ncbi:MAG: class II histone deacetylase [Actinobacteria bacterium]|nr:class II histone deacetylase [Actinomycetota bacterium]
MSTGFIWRERFGWHDLGAGAGPLRAGGWIEPGEPHAEHAATKRRIYSLVEESGLLERLTRLPARPAGEEELALFHTERHIAQVRELSAGAGGPLGLDAWVPPGSYEIAALAAGAAIGAVDAVLDGEVDNCYALVRPPGHHAEADEGKGFCIFNNVVLAARHARRDRGLERVAILDWDVHHGNGAQAAFYDDPSVLTISIHQDGVFPPGSGAVAERGSGEGLGANLNVPLPPGSGAGAYEYAFERVVLPALERFAPQLVLVACGFDANGFDPMSRQLLHSGAFAAMTAAAMAVADAHCDGRLVMTHEGGYHTGTVPFCALAVLERLAGEPTAVVDPFREPLAGMPGQDLQAHQREAVDRAATGSP